MKIVSFLPSATEILYALNLGRAVHGVSHECDYPPQVTRKPVVMQANFPSQDLSDRQIDRRVREALQRGRELYRIDQVLLERIAPDLIVTQKLCDVCAVSTDTVQAAIRGISPRPKVLSLHPHSLEGVFEDIVSVGKLTGKTEWAKRYADSLRRRVVRVREKTRGLPRRRVFSMEWCDPIMNAGHWIPEMVWIAGGVEGLSEKGKPSVRIPWEKVRRYNPEVLLIMPCGFSMRQSVERAKTLSRLPGWRDLLAVRMKQVYCLDGSSYYNRPGPRLVEGLEIMAKLIHPEVFKTSRFKKGSVQCL
ncbi:MAG: cobalamin-binding protein [Candidatus Omnitrophica bacterium]|nr:cobalamin-binding protein [Candidatus Omnitrophota bacterium]